MKGRGSVLFSIIMVLLVIGFTGPTRSQMPKGGPPTKPGMTAEEMIAAIEAWQDAETRRSRDLLREELMVGAQRVVRVDDRQWSHIRPLIDEILEMLRRSVHPDCQPWYSPEDKQLWCTLLETRDPAKFRIQHHNAKTPDQMTEAEKAVEQLLTLVVDENATDAQLKRGIEAVQRARSDAVEQVRQKQEELMDLLRHPRQEAFFLIINILD